MILDMNISWGNWPFQKDRFSSVKKLKAFLRENGIGGGLVRSAEAAFAPDLEYCNEKLFAEFKDNDDFIPVPTVNPAYSEWKELLASDRAMPAVAVYPGYHGYSVLSEGFTELACTLENRNIALIVVVREEDERGHNKFCQIPSVPVKEINELGKNEPKLNIICLNCYFHELKILLSNATNINADIAFAETLNTIKSILQVVGHEQIVFGSHTPFLYTVSALMKLKDSDVDERVFRSIATENAKRILK